MSHSKLLYLLGQDYSNWTCNNPEYYSYITPLEIINKIIELSKVHFRGLDDKVIWDMFAGIGCDGIRFSKHAGKVIMSEVDNSTFQDLLINTNDIHNVETHNVDCCLMKETVCDIIYFDPPWGDNYRTGETFEFDNVLLPNGVSITQLALEISRVPMIIKSPISSDSFERLFGDRISAIFTFTQQKLKFLLVM